MSEQNHDSTEESSTQASPADVADETAAVEPTGPANYVAKAGFPYLWRRWLMTFILVGVGGWCLYDGFVKMPRDNENAIADAKSRGIVLDEKRLPHPGWDIPFNKGIGMAAPPLAIVFLVYSLYQCRGKISLVDRTLSVPGHPPFSIDYLRAVDDSRWERKGIALVTYQTPQMAQARQFKLDDFLYEQEPIDAIYKVLSESTKAAPPVPIQRAGAVPPRAAAPKPVVPVSPAAAPISKPMASPPTAGAKPAAGTIARPAPAGKPAAPGAPRGSTPAAPRPAGAPGVSRPPAGGTAATRPPGAGNRIPPRPPGSVPPRGPQA